MSELKASLSGRAVQWCTKSQVVEIPLSLEGMIESLFTKHLEPSTPEQKRVKFVLWKEHSRGGGNRHRGGGCLSWIYSSVLRAPTSFPNLLVRTPAVTFISPGKMLEDFSVGKLTRPKGGGGTKQQQNKNWRVTSRVAQWKPQPGYSQCSTGYSCACSAALQQLLESAHILNIKRKPNISRLLGKDSKKKRPKQVSRKIKTIGRNGAYLKKKKK